VANLGACRPKFFYAFSPPRKAIPEIVGGSMRQWLDDLSVRMRVVVLLGAIVITTVLIIWL
jgi:hypothetical protein